MNPAINSLRSLALLITGLWTLATSVPAAAPFGMVDPTFNPPRFTARCYPYRCYSDGRGGLLWTYVDIAPENFAGADDTRVGGLVRTTTDGVLDSTFNAGPNLREALGVAVQSDGKILVGGRWVGDVALDGSPNYRVFRLLPSGALDGTYHSPVFATVPRFLTVQPDGKVLVVGAVMNTLPGNGGITDLARLNTDGMVDSSFHRPAFGSSGWGIYAPAALDPYGCICVAGGFDSVDGQARTQVARLFPDGTLDQTFVPSGFKCIGPFQGLVVLPDRKVVITGGLQKSGGGTNYLLMRLDSGGSLDSSFTLVPSSTLGFSRVRVPRTTADGKILAIGTSMARFNGDGSVDNSFTRLPLLDALGNPGANGYWFEQLADGRLVLPSNLSSIGAQPFGASVRLSSDGTLDPAFSSPQFQQEAFPTVLAQQRDQRLLVAGTFDHASAHATPGVARLCTNGLVDTSYTLGISNATAVLNLVSLPNDEAYAIVRTADPSASSPTNMPVRLLPNGTLAPGFSAAPSSLSFGDPFISDLVIQGGQPIVVGSCAEAFINRRKAPIVRLLPDGSSDPNFQPDFTVAGYVDLYHGLPLSDWSNVTVTNVLSLTTIEFQLLATTSENKILAAQGGFLTYQLIRLNANGTLDATFTGHEFGPAWSTYSNPFVHDQFGNFGQISYEYPVRCITAVVVQPDGGVVLGGTFTNVDGLFRAGIARLRPDFTLDPGFPAAGGPATPGGLTPVKISGLSADAAGKIWVAGNFVQWDGISAPGYVRLNADGRVDPPSVPQSAYYPVNDFYLSSFCAAQPINDSACYALGPHLVPGEAWPRALSRLITYSPPPLYPAGVVPGFGFGMSVDSISGQAYWLQTSSDLRTWQDWFGFTGTGLRMFFTDPEPATSPQKFYRVRY